MDSDMLKDWMPVIVIFAVVAALGFFASLVAHIAAYVGVSEPFGIDPWPLHLGIFVVFIPAVVLAHRLSRDFPQKDIRKAMLRGCPKWMRLGMYIVGAYAMANFGYFALSSPYVGSNTPEHVVARGFSGHWLLFYYSAFAFLCSSIQIGYDDSPRRCRTGHLLAPADIFCPSCGESVKNTWS